MRAVVVPEPSVKELKDFFSNELVPRHPADHSVKWPTFNGRTARTWWRRENGLPMPTLTEWSTARQWVSEKLPHYVCLDPERYSTARLEHWNDGEDRLSELPHELQLHIFSLLPEGRDVLRVAQLNKHYSSIFPYETMYAAGRNYFRAMSRGKNVVIAQGQRELAASFKALQTKDEGIRELNKRLRLQESSMAEKDRLYSRCDKERIESQARVRALEHANLKLHEDASKMVLPEDVHKQYYKRMEYLRREVETVERWCKGGGATPLPPPDHSEFSREAQLGVPTVTIQKAACGYRNGCLF